MKNIATGFLKYFSLWLFLDTNVLAYKVGDKVFDMQTKQPAAIVEVIPPDTPELGDGTERVVLEFGDGRRSYPIPITSVREQTSAEFDEYVRRISVYRHIGTDHFPRAYIDRYPTPDMNFMTGQTHRREAVSVLDFAAFKRDVRMIELLMERGEKLDPEVLLFCESPETAAVLLTYGADTSIKNGAGQTPMESLEKIYPYWQKSIRRIFEGTVKDRISTLRKMQEEMAYALQRPENGISWEDIRMMIKQNMETFSAAIELLERLDDNKVLMKILEKQDINTLTNKFLTPATLRNCSIQ